MRKESGALFEPSASEFFGLNLDEREKVKGFLQQKLTKVLNQFPFAPEETTELPILSIEDASQPDWVVIPGHEEALPVFTIEKIMDGVLIGGAIYEGKYKYGPIKRTNIYEVGEDYQRGYKTYDFLFRLNGGRDYIVTKGVEYTSCIKDGMISRSENSVVYTAFLCEDDFLVQIALDEEASNDFGLGSF